MLFQVLTEREEKNSVAIASNESFGGWTSAAAGLAVCLGADVLSGVCQQVYSASAMSVG